MEGTFHEIDQPTPGDANFKPLKLELSPEFETKLKTAKDLYKTMNDPCCKSAAEYVTAAVAQAANAEQYHKVA